MGSYIKVAFAQPCRGRMEKTQARLGSGKYDQVDAGSGLDKVDRFVEKLFRIFGM